MSLSSTIVTRLRDLATVPVCVGKRESMLGNSIVVSMIKVDSFVMMYDKIRTFVHTVWKNLAGPPDCEKAFVVIWMIAAERYDINHHSVT